MDYLDFTILLLKDLKLKKNYLIVVNVVEVLTNESLEVWERLRLGAYSKEGLVSESK